MSDSFSHPSRPLTPSDTSDRAKEEKTCVLCGLPVGRSRAHLPLNQEELRFCCHGCLQVFQILFNSPDGVPAHFRETDLYRSCLASGIISREGSIEERVDGPVAEEAEHARDLTLTVGGMWCPACAWLIEEVLRRTQGVVKAQAFFLSDLVQVRYLPQTVAPEEISDRISGLGYLPSSFAEDHGRSGEKRDLLMRLGISSFLTANIMMISFALYMGFFETLTPTAIRYLSIPLGVLATPVLFYGGMPILRRGINGIRYGRPSMETLISVGAWAAYGYSLVQLVQGSLHVYFDTASMLITLVLLGRVIETQAREKISRGVTELYRLSHQKVRLSNAGRERWVSSEAAPVGTPFTVRTGERVPLDGEVLSGCAKLDQSILTGESLPVSKGAGDEVMGGTLLLEGELRLKATRVGRDSSLGQLFSLMEEALSRKNPFELLSDRLMRWMVPLVFGVAAGTAFYLWQSGVSIDGALTRALTVLVITCPCALGIASPLAKVVAIGAGRENGIFIREPAALEKAKELDVIFFDKTGTLTKGEFSLQRIESSFVSEQEALSALASVETHSNHFLAREIVRKAQERHLEIEAAEGIEAIEGQGIKGVVQGREVHIGNRQWMKRGGFDLPASLLEEVHSMESRGMTLVFFGWNREMTGFLAFGDSLKERSKQVVQELQSRGIEVVLVSGDSKETTRAMAQELGINRFIGPALPRDKLEAVRREQELGRIVGMVGDGINDAAALSQADIGFALGTLSNLSHQSSDILLLTEDPARVIEALRLSSLTRAVIRQNLFFAFCYNLLGIPLAVLGLLNPLIAVFAMFISSLSVIGNSLRILRKKTMAHDAFGSVKQGASVRG